MDKHDPLSLGSVRLDLDDGGIARLTIDRPASRNALDSAANERLFHCWERVDADDRIRVVILGSADCGTFCAGMDLKEAARVRAERGLDILQVLKDPMFERMRSVRKPIVAAMTGHFMAGGMVLALNADLRVGLAGTTGAITEVRVGRGSPWAVPLLWMLPQPVLMEMVLTGEPVAVERLHALGLVNHVEPTPQAVRDRALALAQAIARGAPLSVAAGKASLLAAMSLGCDEGLRNAKALYEPVYASADAQEGPRAFSEKRAPRWTGR
jgi:enoyl-CoA hydratase